MINTFIAATLLDLVYQLKSRMDLEIMYAYAKHYGFSLYEYVPSNGQSGSILLLYNDDLLESMLSTTLSCISMQC